MLGRGWRELGLLSGDLGRSVRLEEEEEEVFLLKTEKAGTDIGLEHPSLSFLFLSNVSQLLSSSLIGSGLGVVGRGGEEVGTDMESERSPRDSNMSRTPSLTAEDCLL